MTVLITFSTVADKQVDEIDAWWRAHRSAAAGLFSQELEIAVHKLAETPFVGMRYARRRGRTVRRILLSRTRHHVFYIVGRRGVFVLGVWSALRGSGPKLGWIR
jgi:hypothetical protein